MKTHRKQYNYSSRANN